MFGFLKKTLKGFVDGLTGKTGDPLQKATEEAKEEPKILKELETNLITEPEEFPREEKEREAEIISVEESKQDDRAHAQPTREEIKIHEIKQETPEAKPQQDYKHEQPAIKHEQKQVTHEQEIAKHEQQYTKQEQPAVKHETRKKTVEEEILEEAQREIKQPHKKIHEEPIHVPKQASEVKKLEEAIESRKPAFHIKEEEKKPELKPKLGLFTQIKSVFTNKVAITEKETESVFSELEISLLESDVSFETTQFLISDLKKRLVGRQVAKNELHETIRSEIEESLRNVLAKSELNFLSELKKHEKPVKILFLGPNGAGKTTTIAKLARLLQDHGLTSVISASDTFRAAAIEQAVFHGEKLGVKVVKHQYGSDPAAVAFDAIEHAKSKGVDIVLIDTAGRQETNQNLLKEMEKINRVINPDYKIFIGEAIAGHSVIEQAKAFHEKVGLTGIILTKIDCDAKGGTSLSLAHDLGVPILFIGTGQEYSDLKEFRAEFIINNIVD